MPLELRDLEAGVATATVEVAEGGFDVTYHPHAAKRGWQTRLGKLQQQQLEAVQVGDEDKEKEVAEQVTATLQELIVDWDLTFDGEKVPVTSEGLDMLSLPIQRAILETVVMEASGGAPEARKKGRKR